MKGALRRRVWLAWVVVTSNWIAACAQLPRSSAQNTQQWSGRLALQVQGDAEKSLHAGFTLQGTAEQGALTLYSPLGQVLGQLHWTPGQATLEQGQELRHANSVQALTQALTGSPVPIAAVFDWLHGQPTAEPGWSVDLQQLGHGRLSATREQPAPRTVLRLILDQ